MYPDPNKLPTPDLNKSSETANFETTGVMGAAPNLEKTGSTTSFETPGDIGATPNLDKPILSPESMFMGRPIENPSAIDISDFVNRETGKIVEGTAAADAYNVAKRIAIECGKTPSEAEGIAEAEFEKAIYDKAFATIGIVESGFSTQQGARQVVEAVREYREKAKSAAVGAPYAPEQVSQPAPDLEKTDAATSFEATATEEPSGDPTSRIDAQFPSAEADLSPVESADQPAPEGLTEKEAQNLVVAQSLANHYNHAASIFDTNPASPDAKKPYAAMILPLDDEPKDGSRVSLLTKRGIVELKILNAEHPHEEIKNAMTSNIDLSDIIERGQPDTILGLNTGGENGYNFNVQLSINDFTNENIPMIQDRLQKVEDQNAKGLFRNETNAGQSMEIKLP